MSKKTATSAATSPMDLTAVYGLLSDARRLAGEIVGSLVEPDTADRAADIAAKIREASYALDLATA